MEQCAAASAHGPHGSSASGSHVSLSSPCVPLVLIGGGGHARVLLDVIEACNRAASASATATFAVLGYFDDQLPQTQTQTQPQTQSAATNLGVPWLGTLHHLEAAIKLIRTQEESANTNSKSDSEDAPAVRLPVDVQLVCAIGDNRARQRVVQRMDAAAAASSSSSGVRECAWSSLVHPRAVVSSSATVGCGSQILALGVVGAGAKVGRHTIVNTSASVDHDAILGDFVHVAPGAHLCGGVRMDEGAMAGVGASLVPRVHIGAWATVGAGTTVLGHVEQGHTVHSIVKARSSSSSSSSSSNNNQKQEGGPIAAAVPAVSTASATVARLSWLAVKGVDWSRVHSYLGASIARNHMTNGGPCVLALESRLMHLLQIDSSTKTVILINNGSSAIHAIVSALQLQSGRRQRVVTQSFTFPASAQASCDGARIIDCDAAGGADLSLIDPATMDVLIVTNCFGHLTDLNKYEQWAKKHDKALIFDNAATSFSFFDGQHGAAPSSAPPSLRNCLNFGTGATISFHHTKPCGFGEGGAIIVDKELEPKIRQVMNFGYDVPRGDVQWQSEGNNFKMADTAAAFLSAYLDDFPSIVAAHQRVYESVGRAVAALGLPDKAVTLFPSLGVGTPFASCVPLLFASAVSEATVVRMAAKHDVDLRKYYKPLDPAQPVSADLYARIVCTPCHRDMTDQHVQRIARVVADIHSEITHAHA